MMIIQIQQHHKREEMVIIVVFHFTQLLQLVVEVEGVEVVSL